MVILKGYEKASMSFMTLCHASGMLVPCVLGHFLRNERMTLLSLLGVLLTVLSVIMIKNTGDKSGKINTVSALMGVTVFASSGGVMILQKLMWLCFKGDSAVAYNFCSFLLAALIMAALTVPCRERLDESGDCEVAEKRGQQLGKMVLCATGSAISLCIISVVMTALAGAVPSIILFPLFNGTGIIAVCAGSVLSFSEKMHKRQIAGLILGILGMCIVSAF